MTQGPGQATRTPAGRGSGGGERSMVEPAQPASYHGRPIVKEPVWTWEIPTYFFVGGLAGGCATLGALADVAGRPELARRAWPLALAGAAASPALLIADLGRPERFLHMLRVARPTSPMSMGTWVLTGLGGSLAAASAHALLGRLPRLGPPSKAVAGALGPVLSTYTAVLVANTAVPVWHEARRELPFVFAASSAASAGGAVAMLAPAGESGPARRFALLGAVGEEVAVRAMEHRLRDRSLLGSYRHGAPCVLARAARGLTAAGAGLLGVAGGRSRPARLAGGACLLAGSACRRFSVFRAGFASARDPAQTVGPQRARLESG